MDKGYDHLVKLLFIGDSGVGKSSLLVRACDDTFSDSYISTIGVDLRSRRLLLEIRSLKFRIGIQQAKKDLEP